MKTKLAMVPMMFALASTAGAYERVEKNVVLNAEQGTIPMKSLRCSDLTIQGEVQIVNPLQKRNPRAGEKIEKIVIACDRVQFEPGAVLKTSSDLYVRAALMTGDVQIKGTLNLPGRMGRSGADGIDGSSGADGANGRSGDNGQTFHDSDRGGNGGSGVDGRSGTHGAIGLDGENGRKNVRIDLRVDRFDPTVTLNLESTGGDGGEGGKGGRGGHGGKGGNGGQGGRGGDASGLTHSGSDGGNGGNGGHGGVGGNGGKGGNGGNGGDGGDVYVILNESAMDAGSRPVRSVLIDNFGGSEGRPGEGGPRGLGGNGGKGGRGGKGGLKSKIRSGGSDGAHGIDGNDGAHGVDGGKGEWGVKGQRGLVSENVTGFYRLPSLPPMPVDDENEERPGTVTLTSMEFGRSVGVMMLPMDTAGAFFLMTGPSAEPKEVGADLFKYIDPANVIPFEE